MTIVHTNLMANQGVQLLVHLLYRSLIVALGPSLVAHLVAAIGEHLHVIVGIESLEIGRCVEVDRCEITGKLIFVGDDTTYEATLGDVETIGGCKGPVNDELTINHRQHVIAEECTLTVTYINRWIFNKFKSRR